MRLIRRYVVLFCFVAVFLVLAMSWSLLRNNQDVHIRHWGPDAVFYNSMGNSSSLLGIHNQAVQFDPLDQARVGPAVLQADHWKTYLLKQHKINVYLSDFLPLNREIPDSRPDGCRNVFSNNLPSVGIVITCHNEWPSLLFRTVYSVINRTPKKLLRQIIIVDDASKSETYKSELAKFISENLDTNIVKLITLKKRSGVVQARLEGLKHITADTVAFLDSHMEVNKHWVEPLLEIVKKEKETIAMAQLDYIQSNSLKYSFKQGYRTRYGFDWRLKFFETEFRKSQLNGSKPHEPLPGPIMVGSAFLVDRQFFIGVGSYDPAMKIWGGENLELSWRVWLCGGKLLHVPCSRIGHIARDQPYDFTEGRRQIELFNYKRAVGVWLGDYVKYVYKYNPDMMGFPVGNLSERLQLREKFKCKPFSWYLKNVWPELFDFQSQVNKTGGIGLTKLQPPYCLDNNLYLFSDPTMLQISICTFDNLRQNFALTKDGKLRTILQCVSVKKEDMDYAPYLQNCLDTPDTWDHTKTGLLMHLKTRLCLAFSHLTKSLHLSICEKGKPSMTWAFHDEKYGNS